MTESPARKPRSVSEAIYPSFSARGTVARGEFGGWRKGAEDAGVGGHTARISQKKEEGYKEPNLCLPIDPVFNQTPPPRRGGPPAAKLKPAEPRRAGTVQADRVG